MNPEIHTMVSLPPLNEANHHFVLASIGHSSTGPFLMIPTPSFKPTHTNESIEGFVNSSDSMAFVAENDKMKPCIVTPTLNVSRRFSMCIIFSTGYIKNLQLKYIRMNSLYNK